MESKGRIITTAIAFVFLVCSVGYAGTIKQTDQTNTIKKAQQSNAEKKASKEAAKAGKKKANKMVKIANKDVVQGHKDVKAAIKCLDKKKPEVDKAIKRLQSATGEFEVAVSLDKDLAFAPVENSIQTYMLFASSDEIERELAFIEDLLEDGKVQDARRLLMPLRNEVVVQTISVPMVTYPEAIKDATRQLSDGTVEKAKEILETAMDTLVVDEEIISIPLVTAKNAIEKASKMDKKKKVKVLEQLKLAKEQLKLASVLGYLSDDGKLHDDLQAQMEKIEKEVTGKNKAEKLYDKLKAKMEGLFD